MNTKKAIEFLENTIYFQKKSDDIITYKRYDELIKEVINLLKRGEKFEQMWGEIKEIYNISCQKYGIEYTKLKKIIELLEQKYFPE